jgi:hypothetical protein
MRKHVALLVLIVATVVALVLIRPARPQRPVSLLLPPPSEAPLHFSTIDPTIESELDDSKSAPRNPAVPAPKEAAPKSEPAPPAQARSNIITVLDPDGVPVPNATIFSVTHSYAQPSSSSKVKEERTDENGELKITLGRHATAHFISYKVGVGSGVTGEVRPDKDATLKYEKSLTVNFKCIAPHGVALEGAEVILTTEVLLGTRRDFYGNELAIVIPLPPRKILTDREGVSTFSAVLSPRLATAGWRAVPGICHRVSAAWYTMVAQDTIEKPPAGPVVLVLQQ